MVICPSSTEANFIFLIEDTIPNTQCPPQGDLAEWSKALCLGSREPQSSGVGSNPTGFTFFLSTRQACFLWLAKAGPWKPPLHTEVTCVKGWVF